MPWDIKYNYVTTDGLPPLDGLPPKLALSQGQEQKFGYGLGISTTGGSGSGNVTGHQFACPSSLNPSLPLSCGPADPPPPYTAMSVSQKQQPRARPSWRTISTGATDRIRRNVGSVSISDPLLMAMHTNRCYSYIPRSNIQAIPSHSHSKSYYHTCTSHFPDSHYYPPTAWPSPSSFPPDNLPCNHQGNSASCLSCQSHEGVPLPNPIGSIIPGTRETSLVIPSSSPLPSGQASGAGISLEFGYIFPPNHTTIHLIEPEYNPFKHSRPPSSASFRFRIYKVSTCLTIAEFMRQVCFHDYYNTDAEILDSNPEEMMVSPPGACSDLGDEVYAYGILENIELGDGRWARGQGFWVGGDNGVLSTAVMRKRVQSLTLADVGWDETRGTDRARPVWISTTVVWE